MKFGSLFSGIGGFDLGFERAGLECEWQVEIDKDCQRVLKRAWPHVQRFDDVTTVREFSAVDVICGGFPCQDLSVAGKRKGLAGERSGLWFEFLRIIKSNQPRWVVIENVPGLLSSESGSDFRVIVNGLVGVGYCVGWRVLDAQYFGVAQRRRRVFIVGSLGNGSCAEILFESESVSRNPPTRREAGSRTPDVSVRRAQTSSNGWGIRTDGSTGTLDGTGGDAVIAGHFEQNSMSGRGTLGWNESDQPLRPIKPQSDHQMVVTHTLRSEGADASEDGTGRGTPIIPIDMRQASRGEKMTNNRPNGSSGGPPGTGIGNAGDPCPTIADSHVPAILAFSSKDHGADAGNIAPTLRAQNFKDSHMNGGGQIAIAFSAGQGSRARSLAESDEHTPPLKAHASGLNQIPSVSGHFGVRRLTPTECERLQSFPDDFTRWDADGKEISDSARYRMLGNAVPVNVSQWVGERILKLER